LRPEAVVMIVALLAAVPVAAAAQQADPYTPIDGAGRVNWIVVGTVGTESLVLIGPMSASWNTMWDQPEEWTQDWNGWGKRYMQREADVAISNSLEGGLGAIWGEDPRYFRAGRGSFKSRLGYALKTAWVAPRRDGHLAPAWGRYLGNTVNNIIENTWLPPSATTPWQTTYRSLAGMASRMLSNVWDEFWPDVRKRLQHR
jgi:hypothetical protein